MKRHTRYLVLLLSAGGIGLPSAAQEGANHSEWSARRSRTSGIAPEGSGPMALLVRNQDTDTGAPPFALLDQYGRVQRLVEPTPGLDLAAHVGQRVRIRHDTGKTLLASQLELPSALAPLRPLQNVVGNRVAALEPTPRTQSPRFEVLPVQLVDDEQPAEELTPPWCRLRCRSRIRPSRWCSRNSSSRRIRCSRRARSCRPKPPPCRSTTCRRRCSSPRSNPARTAPADRSIPASRPNRNATARNAAPRLPARDAAGGGGCCLGEPWTLKGSISPCGTIDYGGWTQVGFHTEHTRLSATDNDGAAFNDHPDRLNLHQQWLWIERHARPTHYGIDWGFRADLMYGTDAAKTQAFGNTPGNWDFMNGWDRGGGYGWAAPQLYGEVAWQDWSVIAGHFYTLVGYEVVTAPDNFFYSHSLTMFNSEPFTHTGLLATYSGAEKFEIYGGWTLGWDTGFDSSNSGSNLIGGFSSSVTEDIEITYITTIGNFGDRSGGADGYSHSIVLDVMLTCDLDYILQTDLLTHKNSALSDNDQVGINQYLIYTLNDCWAMGTRFEWWKSDGFSYHEWTVGLNYRPHANVVIRPELRYDWTPSNAGAINQTLASAGDYEETTFGVDAILTY